MLYREAGQFKSSYVADMAIFPLRQDRIGIAVILALAVLAPLVLSSFAISSLMIPVLIFSLATIGLNILTGYTGLVSLGTGAFMGIGAFATYKLTTFFPAANIVVLMLVSGLVAAAVGVVFGLPSLRIKGFYRLRRWRRSSSSPGASSASPGFTITTSLPRSRCRRAAPCPFPSPGPTPRRRFATTSCSDSSWR